MCHMMPRRHYLNYFIFLLGLGLVNSSGLGGLKNYCLAEKDDCDEFWTPFHNLASALVGYDLPKGNPFSPDSIEDPGLRKQIFNATFEDKDTGDFLVETGVASREYRMCEKEFKSRGATSMKGYEKVITDSSSLGFGFDIGIEAEDDGARHEGLLPPMVSVAWQKTNGYEKVRQFIFRTRGAVVVSEAQCITHKVEVSHFLTPGFHPAYIEVLRYLEKQDTLVRQTRAFKRFVRDYGTHFISSALMGSKISATVFYTNYERLKYGRAGLYNCTAEFAARAFGVKGEDEEETKKNKKNKNKDDDDEEDEEMEMAERRCPYIDPHDPNRSVLARFGPEPPEDGDLAKWAEDLEDIEPIPIKFELSPIVNLFTHENIDERHNISSSKILKWFLPLYLKYCKVFDFDCSVETGCGFDDTCGFDENCVRDRAAKNGFKCQATSWADVPNWPQLPVPVQNSGSDPNKIGKRTGVASSSTGGEPESPNISWFFDKDLDSSNSLTMDELWVKYAENNWYNQRYQTAMEKWLFEADANKDRSIDMDEYIKLHEKHPWYAEQISFMLMNTDGNDHLSRQELLEASRISPDMHQLNFGLRQLENLVDGLLAIGDKDKDNRLTFQEYVDMSKDVFVDNFAPNVFKRILRT